MAMTDREYNRAERTLARLRQSINSECRTCYQRTVKGCGRVDGIWTPCPTSAKQRAKYIKLNGELNREAGLTA